ncbi:MAG: amidophosphoribosyltransferase [Deltaproteobacteria bacterium]|nr:amidophosphoribosyltransferase [Deltaproteobacteria bacterium]MBW2052085.1 amidophosphoribosyltransferase [Deltaproteobacteria bacterium]MBW2140706.1 amidophosphoribosyltransferase [Deltaproteobacteria bacterium]MBW2322344.1 amidophosphoribosyltransferase [Deltaproteobacteria bacterium]
MKRVQDNCGVFGLYSNTQCVEDIYQGIDFLQHRGQEYCGIATYDGRIRQVTHHGKVGNTFTDQNLNYLTGTWGIGHVSLKERQPVRWQSSLGEIALAFSGNIINSDELIQGMMQKGRAFQEGYDIEIISKIILEVGDPVEGIAALSQKIKGAYTLVVLTKDGIYATRDVYGFRPLIIGQGSGKYVVGSESRAIRNLDMEVVRDVKPGEIILINEQGFKTCKQLESPRRAHCAFEWAYTSSIDSVMEGVYVQETRNNMGARLAKRDMEDGGIEADLVAPVPMSGIGHALGYHMQSKINYQEVFLYNRYADRSYTQSTQVAREKMAKRKLSVLGSSVKGQRVILCDDSIVRGTQILYKVRDLKKAGAREVHVRVACPPLMYPCDFGISTRSYEELKARQYMPTGNIDSMEQLKELENWVAGQIKADSVKYNSLDAFVEAIGIPRQDLCLKCWNGHRPTENHL